MSEEALQIAEKRREVKAKEKRNDISISMPSSKELARRDKKAFLSDQCKETENNRMGKTRDLFKKIRGNKGTFLVTMGTIEQRNSMNLTEHIKKKCQEYTEELHKKDLNDPDKPQWCDHSPRARHPGV